MKTTTSHVISRRQKTSGPNHHLQNNHGTWWFHATVHLPDHTARRVRFSLRTKDVAEARRKRDRILRQEPAESTCRQAA